MTGTMGGSGRRDDRSLSELLAEMSNQVKVLISKEVELAKLEIKESASLGSKSAVLLAGGGLIGLLALVFLSSAAAWGLAEVVAPGVAFLIVGVVYLLSAGVLLMAGRKRLAAFKPAPTQTIETVKDDVAVAKGSLSRGMKT